MILIRKIILVIGGALVLMSLSCKEAEAIVKETPPEFQIINAYTQKQVPGEQNQKPYIEFGFEVKGLISGTIIDSVFCEVGQSIEIKEDGRNRLKLLIEYKLIDELKYDKAFFYHSQKGESNQFELNDIKKKETVFLP
jgi:hypothetical protein